MAFKASRYNHFQQWPGGGYLVYNSLAGSVAVMTDENYRIYRVLIEKLGNHPPVDLVEEETALAEQLRMGRFLCRGDVDERDYLKMMHYLNKYDRTTLNLSFAPTMACNMACEYCFEGNKSGRMSEDVINRVIALVNNQTPLIRKLDVGWYGGEPLLAMGIVDRLSSAFIDICDREKILYGASLISNGYLLRPETTDRLCELRVNSAQVCLDGPKEMHNRRRPLKGGRSSYDSIIDNISYAADKMHITVRINVDKTFSREIIAELLHDLEAAGLHKKITVTFGLVNVATPVCANISERCYDIAEFAGIEVDFYRLLLDEGFRIQNTPKPKSVICMAQTVNAFLIDHDGDVYRCLIYSGDKSKSIGNIADPIEYLYSKCFNMLEFDPLEDPTCGDCLLLPACMGGCPSRRIFDGLSGDDVCSTWKHNLRPMLEIIAQAQMQAMQTAEKEVVETESST